MAAAGVVLAVITGATAGAQERVRPPSTLAPAADWGGLLSQGRSLPTHERLVILARDGRVLRVVDGEDTRVLLPVDIQDALITGRLRATLVHNHLVDRSFSCADLRHLGTPGVDGVVAVSGAGSVFETRAGSRFDADLFEGPSCETLLRLAASSLAFHVGHELADPSDLADQVPHLLASALDRLGIIEYRSAPALRSRMTQVAHHVVFDRVVERLVDEVERLRRSSDRASSSTAERLDLSSPASLTPAGR